RWRYALWRTWQPDLGYVMFIGLNPSTADEIDDDPTVRGCRNFAAPWGYGGIYMMNIFAYRATLPEVMKAARDPIGQATDRFIRRYRLQSKLVVACWGTFGEFRDRGY